MNRAKVLLSCFACLLVALSVTGCVDIYGAKGVFGGKTTPGPVVYRERLKGEVAHAFETKPTDPGTWTIAASCATLVKKGTQWLNVYIDLTMLILPPQLIPNVTLPERYLRVIVTMADGAKWIDARYVATAHECITALNPIDGLWTMSAEATGVGSAALGLQDSFKVMMTVREPS